MSENPEVLDSVPEQRPDTIGTPEGDGEFAPDQPLTGDDVDVTRPRGDEPHSNQPERPALSRERATEWGLRIHGVNLIPTRD